MSRRPLCPWRAGASWVIPWTGRPPPMGNRDSSSVLLLFCNRLQLGSPLCKSFTTIVSCYFWGKPVVGSILVYQGLPISRKWVVNYSVFLFSFQIGTHTTLVVLMYSKNFFFIDHFTYMSSRTTILKSLYRHFFHSPNVVYHKRTPSSPSHPDLKSFSKIFFPDLFVCEGRWKITLLKVYMSFQRSYSNYVTRRYTENGSKWLIID